MPKSVSYKWKSEGSQFNMEGKKMYADVAKFCRKNESLIRQRSFS